MFRVLLRVIFSWDRWSVVKGTLAIPSPALYTLVLWFTIAECLELFCCMRAHLWPRWNNRNHSLNNTQGMKCGSCMWFCGLTILYLMPSSTVTFGILPDLPRFTMPQCKGCSCTFRRLPQDMCEKCRCRRRGEENVDPQCKGCGETFPFLQKRFCEQCSADGE